MADSNCWVNWVVLDIVVARGVSIASVLEGREAREDWAAAEGVRVCEGVKRNGLAWENWEKLLAAIVAETEKEGPILEVMGAIEIARATKDCEVRKEGAIVTC